MKKTLSVLLIAAMLLLLLPAAFAEGGDSRAVIGADLTDEQIAEVYKLFGVDRGSVIELRVTNAEEREYLEGYVDDAQLGHYSISCVYVRLLEAGSGLSVSTHNITWCTEEMYIGALVTAGITDAEIIVASPFEVSGTAALTGMFKAYEDITGEKLDDSAKDAGTRELTVTGELAGEIGDDDAAGIVTELKGELGSTAGMSDSELREEIISVSGKFGVTLSENQIKQLMDLCRSFEKLDPDSLMQRVEDVKNTLHKISEAKDKAVGFFDKMSRFFTAVSEFFAKLKSIFS